jgi:hypothetical protein
MADRVACADDRTAPVPVRTSRTADHTPGRGGGLRSRGCSGRVGWPALHQRLHQPASIPAAAESAVAITADPAAPTTAGRNEQGCSGATVSCLCTSDCACGTCCAGSTAFILCCGLSRRAARCPRSPATGATGGPAAAPSSLRCPGFLWWSPGPGGGWSRTRGSRRLGLLLHQLAST